MITNKILFIDSILGLFIGSILLIVGIFQILREPNNYGMIGYSNHRVYTSVGILQIINIIRIIDNSEIIRIITQWIFDIESLVMIYGILFFSIHIITITKNIIKNITHYSWINLNLFVKTLYISIFIILGITTNLATILRFIYRYEFWTVIIILANILTFLFITIILNFYLYRFFKEIDKITKISFNSDNINNVVKNLKIVRFFYIILVSFTFYFLSNFVKYYFTEYPLTLDTFNYDISYLRYIILLTCFIMMWISYIPYKNSNNVISRTPNIVIEVR